MLLGGIFYEYDHGRLLLRAMPVMLGVLCVFAIAYRYYSAFLAAKVAALDDAKETPAHRLNDGQNFHPTNKWVLFGHHFAAISGAGPLIGPVIAVQFGYLPSLLWLVIGVCLAGAVQDMLVLAASVRHGGKSLGEIARSELGPWASVVVSVAILFIVVVALAGLGAVVVKALGGDEIKLAEGMSVDLPPGTPPHPEESLSNQNHLVYRFPEGCTVNYPGAKMKRPESFLIQVPAATPLVVENDLVRLPAGAEQLIPGSSWGTFTIACTIPIALFVGLYMYRIRKGRVLEASLIGAAGVVAVTILGNHIPGSPLERFFSLSREQTVLAMMGYGFVAAVLPVWLLLCPRDYLSSFLKIGTIALLVVGVIVANPTLKAQPIDDVFGANRPTFKGDLFPFVFICVMCGAVSGFHALVSSGTTPKMINKERDIRPIGYGAMLMESVVGVVALIAASALPWEHYYAMNTPLKDQQKYEKQLKEMETKLGSLKEARDRMHETGIREPHQLPVGLRDLSELETLVGNESLRGRTGGAVTLAVGMSVIFSEALQPLNIEIDGVMKYWFHFALMFEALFILTTIDTGTRIARFLLQETMGRVHPQLGKPDWLPGAALSTLLVTVGWGGLIWSGSIETIWPMFGLANQLLVVIALSLVTTVLFNTGRGRFAWVTVLPMLWVLTTTGSAGYQMVTERFPKMIELGGQARVTGILNIAFTVFVMSCVATLLVMAVSRWLLVGRRGTRYDTGEEGPR
jgi:carbon starvation protein